MPSRIISSVLVFICLGFLGCNYGSIGEPSSMGTDSESIVNGTLTCEHPEIGLLLLTPVSNPSINGICTATLVSPTVVLTAAHCVYLKSESVPGNEFLEGSFTINMNCPNPYQVSVREVISYASEDDIALVRLADPVPATVATPAPIAAMEARQQEEVAVYGHGCNQRAESTDYSDWSAYSNWDNKKRELVFSWKSLTRSCCPGDSGGPVLNGEGEIVAILAGRTVVGIIDLFPDITGNRNQLLAQIAAWTQKDDYRDLCKNRSGYYCVGNSLVHCNKDHSVQSADLCGFQCQKQEEGIEDICLPPPAKDFCGDLDRGNWCDQDTLNQCNNHMIQEKFWCPYGCQQSSTNPPAASCNAIPTHCGGQPKEYHCNQIFGAYCEWSQCSNFCFSHDDAQRFGSLACQCAAIESADNCINDCAWYACANNDLGKCLPKGTDTWQVCGHD